MTDGVLRDQGERLYAMVQAVIEWNAELLQAREQSDTIIDRTRTRLQEYVDRGVGEVNPKQILGLLSSTWPDGNYVTQPEETVTDQEPVSEPLEAAEDLKLVWSSDRQVRLDDPIAIYERSDGTKLCSREPDDTIEGNWQRHVDIEHLSEATWLFGRYW